MKKQNSIRQIAFSLLAIGSLFATPLPLCAQTADSANPAAIDTPRDAKWMKHHEEILSEIKQGPVNLLLIGDSITDNYHKTEPPNQNYKPIWDKFYAPRHAVNLGVGGDQTQHVLWRLDHGEVDGLSPKAAILLIGTNNTGHGQTVEQTIGGIEAVVAKIHEKLPATKVLLLGILPSDRFPGKWDKDIAVNAAVSKNYASSDFVTFLDISPLFLKDGKVDWSLYYDPTLKHKPGTPPTGPVHPTAATQEKMAEALEPTLSKLMGDANPTGQ